jgi:hypothetical protein
MNADRKSWTDWSPRLLALLVAAFLGIFSLDAFSGRGASLAAFGAFLIHLAPAAIVVVVVALAWRRPWAGAVLFGGLAVFYALVARRTDWIVAISGPLLIVAASYVWSGWHGRGGQAMTRPHA